MDSLLTDPLLWNVFLITWWALFLLWMLVLWTSSPSHTIATTSRRPLTTDMWLPWCTLKNASNLDPKVSHCMGASLGSKLTPLLIGWIFELPNKYPCLQSEKHFCTLKGGNLNPKRCKDERCRLSIWGVHRYVGATNAFKGANLSWLHLYGCKLAFVVQESALNGAGIVIFWGAHLCL